MIPSLSPAVGHAHLSSDHPPSRFFPCQRCSPLASICPPATGRSSTSPCPLSRDRVPRAVDPSRRSTLSHMEAMRRAEVRATSSCRHQVTTALSRSTASALTSISLVTPQILQRAPQLQPRAFPSCRAPDQDQVQDQVQVQEVHPRRELASAVVVVVVVVPPSLLLLLPTLSPRAVVATLCPKRRWWTYRGTASPKAERPQRMPDPRGLTTARDQRSRR